eukprot:SAG11_NODE_2542_length_3237_cov_1.924841_5_plen_51_part_00
MLFDFVRSELLKPAAEGCAVPTFRLLMRPPIPPRALEPSDAISLTANGLF